MPPASTSRLAQYARGQSDPTLGQSAGGSKPQQRNETSSNAYYYPPSSNPNSRPFANDAARPSITRMTTPRRPSRTRENSNGSMPPMLEPPAYAPPSKPDATPRRRANSDDRGRFYDPSLPSNLGTPSTPFDSPPGEDNNAFDDPHDPQALANNNRGAQPPTLDMAASQRATNHLAPFVTGPGGSINMAPNNPGPGLFRHQSMRNQGHAAQNGGEPSNVELGYLSSPDKQQVKLPIHNGDNRKSYAGPSRSIGFENFGHASSATMEGSPRGRAFDRGRTEDIHRKAFIQDDEEYGDLSSNFPLSDDLHGTPRAGAAKRERQASPPSLALKRLSRAQDQAQVGRGQKRRHGDLDYDDVALQRMSYSDLKDQPFDVNPSEASESPNGAAVGDSLPEKLEHYKGKGVQEQKQLFSQMDLQDWEKSGDWFLEQFALVTQKLKQARQDKRAVVERFEAEIAERETVVHERTDDLNRKLDSIKCQGESIVGSLDV